ncbi:hypothetical protein BLNAU_25142 [Blattamonas nauphoetae]|uniref:Uncharacterized protein n=1 Tax=Blattamonas nauphoetae TaxID=2049346 RepID=A0ABQ9WKS7_9EUKA|nr:hypothetical protein BLNAU_25142 [Blattamonas nauphoetae]
MFLGSDTLLRFDLILLQVNYSFPSSKGGRRGENVGESANMPELNQVSFSQGCLLALSLNCHNIVLGSQTTCDLRGCSPALTLFDPALFSGSLYNRFVVLLQIYATVPDNRVVPRVFSFSPTSATSLQFRQPSWSRWELVNVLLLSPAVPNFCRFERHNLSGQSLHHSPRSFWLDESGPIVLGSMRLQWKNRSGFMYNSLLVEWKIWLPLQLPRG